MANKSYYVEDKYRCNHPESDFESNSKGPIEIKQDRNFVEYTHRNETVNYQYDVWERVSRSATANNSDINSYLNSNTARTTDYYASRNSYNKNTSKKSNLNIIWILLFIYIGLPILFSIFSLLFTVLASIF